MFRVTQHNTDQFNKELQNYIDKQLEKFSNKYESFNTYLSSFQSDSLNILKAFIQNDEEFKKAVEAEIINLQNAKKYFEEISKLAKILKDKTKNCLTAHETRICVDLITAANKQLSYLPLSNDYLKLDSNSQQITFNSKGYNTDLNVYQNMLPDCVKNINEKATSILGMQKNIYNRKAEDYRKTLIKDLAALTIFSLLTIGGIGCLAVGIPLLITSVMTGNVLGILFFSNLVFIGPLLLNLGLFPACFTGLEVCLNSAGFFSNKRLAASVANIENKINNLQDSEKVQVNQNIQAEENTNLLANTL